MPADDILTLPPPPADARLTYGADPNQFGELRMPKSRVLSRSDEYSWRLLAREIRSETCRTPVCRPDRQGAGDLECRISPRWVIREEVGRAHSRTCAALTLRFTDRPTLQSGSEQMVVIGHSAGRTTGAVSGRSRAHSQARGVPGGVVDLQQAWELHLSDNAVVDFLGGEPSRVSEHYREADPMQLKIRPHTMADSRRRRRYRSAIFEPQLHRAEEKARRERALSGNFHGWTLDLIDPRSSAWPKVEGTVLHLLES